MFGESLLVAELFVLAIFVTVMGSLLIGFPVAFTIGGISLAFAGIAALLGHIDLSFLNFFPNRVFGFMTNEVLIAVPLFIFMGVMLERSRVAENMLETMAAALSWLPGGLGISVFVVGALLAASTGIVGATVIAMGLISLPTMIRLGYDKRLACGIVCASGTLGQIIPPSIVLVVVGDQIAAAHYAAQRSLGNFAPETVSVGHIFAAALLPGLLLVGLYMLFILLLALTRPQMAPAVSREKVASHLEGWRLARSILMAVMIPLFLITAVLGSILFGIATPTEAAAVGAVGSVFLGALRHPRARPHVWFGMLCLVGLILATSLLDLRLGRSSISAMDQFWLLVSFCLCAGLAWGVLLSLFVLYRGGALQESARTTASITAMAFAIVICAQVFTLVFRGLGGDVIAHELLAGLPGGAAGAMLLVMVVIFLLGFFLDFLEITFIIVPIVAPVLMMLGLDPLWVGIMIALNMQTSFLTPPFGFSLFYLRGVAPPSIETWHIYQGVVPFILLQILCICLIVVFPNLVTALPNLVYR